MDNHVKKLMQTPLFSFGIITDTHIRAPEGDMSSPFPVNEKANSRARYAAALLAAQHPAFTVHLGDMVHPLPSMPAYASACENAMSIFQPLLPNLHFMPGNHDIGDKPMPGSPAKVINEQAQSNYQQYFGQMYYEFQHDGCLFIVLNSSLINSQSGAEQKQRSWLESLLSTTALERIFLFSHYPLFIHHPDELEHYDNLAEPGRTWLLKLIATYNIELVLSGHVHHYFYNRVGDCCLYTLPPTSFTRQDYAELFRVEPCAEFGRDDTDKYTVTMVDVYKQGHRLRLIPTDGKGLEATEPLPILTATSPPTDKTITAHLRHSWYESTELPCNGPMEEFSRKRARNDYVFMRLQQLGIHSIRVPIQDLQNPVGRQRMRDYKALGFSFHSFCQAHLFSIAVDLVCEHPDLISSLECVSADIPISLPDPALFKRLSGLPLLLGHAQTGAHQSDINKPFAHSVTSGFLWPEHTDVLHHINQWAGAGNLSGVVFQLPWEDELSTTITQMQDVFAARDLTCIVNLRLADANPAVANFDDKKIADRIQQALSLTSTLNAVDLHLDNIVDLDRGYAPRHGLIDRRGNLRTSGRSLMQLTP